MIIIKEIRFNGLKRTRESIALQIIRPVEPGSILSENTEQIIIQELREAGIFNPEISTEVSINNNQAVIDVFVKDKWTLIPIPIVSVSKNGAWRAGILGLEGNLLGYYKTLGLGFFFGSEGWSLLSFFSDDIFMGTDLKFSSSLNFGLNETIDENVDEKSIRNYKSDDIRLGMGLEYPLNEKLSVKSDWNYNRSVIRQDSRADDISDIDFTGLSAAVKWNSIFYDIPYQYGLQAKSLYSWNWGIRETENNQSAEVALKWGINPVFKHLLDIGVLTGWSRDKPVQTQYRLGGRSGSRILPNGRIAATGYVLSWADYNIPLLYFPGGTLSGKIFYEGGSYKSDIIKNTFFHGPGAGLEIFINDLAIPAIQFNIARNMETGLYQFSAGIGSGGGGPD